MNTARSFRILKVACIVLVTVNLSSELQVVDLAVSQIMQYVARRCTTSQLLICLQREIFRLGI